MSEPLEMILRQCEAAQPEPWYPKTFAQATGVPRDSLDPFLEQLRTAGLIELTEWVGGHGQGYRLTAIGRSVLQNPWSLERLRQGGLQAEPYDQAAEQPAARGPMTTYERGEMIRGVLLRPRRPIVTQVLIALNLLVFAYGAYLAQRQNIKIDRFFFVLDQPVEDIDHRLGAIRMADLLHGQWWRLLSACFVHFGLFHIGVNMYSLYALGGLVEQMFGRWRYLLLYLIAGIGGSCTMMIVTPNIRMGAGASGAIWGLMTAMAAWVYMNRGHLPRQVASSWLNSIGSVLLINVIISFSPGISAAGHFGGGGAGLLAAVLLNVNRFHGGVLGALALVLTLLIPVGFIGALVRTMQANPRWQQMARVAEAQQAQQQVAELRADVLPTVDQLERQAEGLYKERAMDQLIKNPRRRDADDVAPAVAALREGVGKLREAIAVLDGAGRLATEKAEKVRTLRKTILEERIQLYELRERCLREGADWKDDPALKGQEARLDSAEQEWRAFPR